MFEAEYFCVLNITQVFKIDETQVSKTVKASILPETDERLREYPWKLPNEISATVESCKECYGCKPVF